MIRVLLHLLFFLSGAAALGYQLVWSKMLSTGLGHEMPAVLAVIGAFMVGIALGALVVDRIVARDIRAGFWLAGLEGIIGLWSILLPFILPRVNELALQWIGLEPGPLKHWLIALAIPAVGLLPATMAMGATLPVMEKFLSVAEPRRASVASVYAANTLGAVAGTLLMPFVLMPALGFSSSCFALAGVNLIVGASLALMARSIGKRVSAGPKYPAASKIDSSPLPMTRQRVNVSLFFLGLLGISYEVCGVRVLSQVLEGTVYTYAAVLAVFLLGTAAGAAALHRWWRNVPHRKLLSRLLYGAGLACLLGMFALMVSGGTYRQCRQWGDGAWDVFAAEMVTAMTVFALPTFFMGSAFSWFAQCARASGGTFGRALAANTFGAALAPVLAVVFLPAVGVKWMLFATAFGYFFVSLPMRPTRFGILFVVVAALGYNVRLQIVDVPPGGRVLSYRESMMGTVAVVEEPDRHRTLRVDNRFQMGGSGAADVEYRQAHLPLLLHPNPRRALFLGVGTGISFGPAALYPALKADGVELLPEVARAMPFFEPQNLSPGQQPQLKIHVADARRFVLRHEAGGYDVIVADLFHPYRDGAGALYTREHFAAVRRQLSAGSNSFFCQWLPLHQLDTPTLRVVIRTFQDQFPLAQAWLLRFNVDVPVVALVGGRAPMPWVTNRVESLLHGERLAAELKRLALTDSLRLYGHLLSDCDSLRAFADGAPLCTDDDQRVTFLAPRAAYQQNAKPYTSLQDLLAASKTEHVVRQFSGAASETFALQFRAYIAARNVYLQGLVHDAEKRRDQALDAYVESARLSPEFTPGYAQCVTFAVVIAKSDPAQARRLLERLIEAQPERLLAREMLERLFRP